MLEINGIFKCKKVSLSGENYFVLTQMYLPLIGMESVAIYLTINNLLEDEIQTKRLLDILGLDNLTIVEKALEKLEAIGLVKEYFSKSKGVYFVLNQPLNGKSFLNNLLLKNYLITQIGSVEYDNLRHHFFNTSVKGYQEVTKSFDEVFKSSNQKNIKTNLNVFLDDEEDNIRIKNRSFDYIYFKMLFEENELSSSVLDDDSFTEQILKISYQYQLNEEEMKNAIMKSMATNKDLKFDDISRCASYIFQNKVPEGVVAFQDKEVQVYDHRFSSDEISILEVATRSSIADILASVSGGKGSVADIRDYTKLMNITGLSNGVINILILYLAGLKEEQNLSFTYIEKVARNWMKAGVKTAEDALLLLRSLSENKTEKKSKKTKVEEPEWMKKEQEEKDEIKSSDELTEEEKKEAERLKKKFFGGNDEPK